MNDVESVNPVFSKHQFSIPYLRLSNMLPPYLDQNGHFKLGRPRTFFYSAKEYLYLYFLKVFS